MAISIYLAASLFVQTGAHEPASTTGRVFLVIWGFTMLIVLSCYTASMATFLTTSAASYDSIRSVEDLVESGLSVCMDAMGTTSISAVKNLYASLMINKVAYSDMPTALKNGQCGAIIIDEASYRTW